MGTRQQPGFFCYERFRFSLEVKSLMVLPPYKGGVFRGAFGSSFRSVVCAVRRVDCTHCLLRQQCLYVAFFESPPPPGCRDAAKFSQTPSPFVLNPPLTNRQSFHPQDILTFELVLMGRAVEALPYFVYSFMDLGRKGIGIERGKYDLTRVELIRGNKEIPVYNGHTQILSAYPTKHDPTYHAEDESMDTVSLHLITPLRLKMKGRLTTNLTFTVFFERLAQRLTLLTWFHGNDVSAQDFSRLISKAKNIQTGKHELHWYDWERYSGRQKAAMKLGGLRGNISFTGELGPFMPFLRLGEHVNVGQGTSFGLGKYEVAVGG